MQSLEMSQIEPTDVEEFPFVATVAPKHRSRAHAESVALEAHREMLRLPVLLCSHYRIYRVMPNVSNCKFSCSALTFIVLHGSFLPLSSAKSPLSGHLHNCLNPIYFKALSFDIMLPDLITSADV